MVELIVTRQMRGADARRRFSSGNPELDRYFRQIAWTNHRRDVSKAYVLETSDVPDVTIGGFFTLSMCQVESAQIRRLGSNYPAYPLPVSLIGRLAVDERCRRRGYGESLLLDAFERSAQTADSFGCIGVVVDAKDEEATGFYENYGFVQLQDDGWPRRLFIAMATIRTALDRYRSEGA